MTHGTKEVRHRPKLLVGPADFGKIHAALARYGPLMQLAARLMYDAGLRVGEVQQLLWKDCVALATPAARLELNPERTKKGYARTVPLPPIVHLEILQAQQLLPLPLVRDEVTHHNVVTSHKGHQVGVRWIEKCFTEATTRALGYNVNPHAFRHSFADRLLKHSNLRVVQLALGHVSLTSTQIYTHPQLAELSTAITAAAANGSEPEQRP